MVTQKIWRTYLMYIYPTHSSGPTYPMVRQHRISWNIIRQKLLYYNLIEYTRNRAQNYIQNCVLPHKEKITLNHQ